MPTKSNTHQTPQKSLTTSLTTIQQPSHTEHPPAAPNAPTGNQNRKQHLVARIAITGIDHTWLSPEERAEFYEGLSTLLPAAPSEAAKYAATCIRECQRAQQEILTTLATQRDVP
jgi:hypothetical protein